VTSSQGQTKQFVKRHSDNGVKTYWPYYFLHDSEMQIGHEARFESVRIGNISVNCFVEMIFAACHSVVVIIADS